MQGAYLTWTSAPCLFLSIEEEREVQEVQKWTTPPLGQGHSQ